MPGTGPTDAGRSSVPASVIRPEGNWMSSPLRVVCAAAYPDNQSRVGAKAVHAMRRATDRLSMWGLDARVIERVVARDDQIVACGV